MTNNKVTSAARAVAHAVARNRNTRLIVGAA